MSLLPRELYLDYLKLKCFPMETLIWVKLPQKYFQFRLLTIAFVLRMRGDQNPFRRILLRRK